MLQFLIFLLVFYGVFCALLYRYQRHMIYHPERNIGTPGQYGLEGFSEYTATTPDNQTICLWHRPAREGFPTIVYFHGNAGHMGDRYPLFGNLTKRGFGLLATSYRGYGKSTGTPSEQGLYTDARTAIAFLQQLTGIAPEDIILFGESLGTGVAVQMALEHNVRLLALQAPYRSVAARAAEMYFFIPVLLLIKDKYNTLEKISRVRAPLVIFHGERDDVIPIEHGKSVLEAATSPKQAFFFPATQHNDFDTAAISEHVLAMAEKYNLIRH